MTTSEQPSSEEQAKIATACKDNPDLPKELVK
ncbi:hypothetical protein CEDIAZO_02233 [Celerinatantimonas diazotrophica]|nr:hypothetical protein CEDIAZO_02233 [Celerinatantimonas diazotrophica]